MTPTPDQRPLVTIGLSTYNRVASTLPEALQSALEQTYPHVEVIVCDNASGDGTEGFMRSQHDERLRYHRHPTNIGANANFNACLNFARGEYFLLLHDDDVLDPTFVERAMNSLDGGEPGVLLSGVRLIRADGQMLAEVPPPPAGVSARELLLNWFDRKFSFYLVSTLFQTKALRASGGFQSPEELFQDVVAIVRLASRYGHGAVPGVGGSFRKQEASRTSASHAMRWARDATHLLQVICEELPDPDGNLRAAGARYLAATSYRHVSAEPSLWKRWQMYHDVDRHFGRSLSPASYVWRVQRKRIDRILNRTFGRLFAGRRGGVNWR
jgi:glycosyltransferase involved in cell wall biosynthesis